MSAELLIDESVTIDCRYEVLEIVEEAFLGLEGVSDLIVVVEPLVTSVDELPDLIDAVERITEDVFLELV